MKAWWSLRVGAFYKDVSKSQLTIFLVLVLLTSILESIVASHYAFTMKGIHQLHDLRFGFGAVVWSLRENGTYVDCYNAESGGFWNQYWGSICFTANRLPFIPIFLAGLSFISQKLLIVSIIKNLLFYAISGLAFVEASRRFKVPLPVIAVLAGIFYFVPENAKVASGIDFEEAYLYHLFPWVFLALIAQPREDKTYLVVGLCLAIILLIKSSVVILCYSCVLYFSYSRIIRRDIWRGAVPLVMVAAAAVMWGSFTLASSGKFAFGTNMSSLNGWNLYKGNNPNSGRYYPIINLDNLDYEGLTQLPNPPRKEWDINAEYQKMAYNFIRGHIRETLSNVAKKLYIAFISISNVPQISGSAPKWGNAELTFIEHICSDDRLSQSVSMLIDRIVLTIGFMLAFVQILQVRNVKTTTVFLAISVIYLVPYVIGFLYSRHIIPLVGVSLLYTIAVLEDFLLRVTTAQEITSEKVSV